MEICGRQIGREYPPLVIADIGINHSGDFGKAVQMVIDAHIAGCECVKFQCHIGHKVKDEQTQELLDRCTLSEMADHSLKDYVEALDMIYLSTPFSHEAVERLERLGVGAYKIGSGQCSDYELVEHVASCGKSVILSTGMNDMKSIRVAVDILRDVPLALVNCTSIYPTPYDKVRLGAIKQLRSELHDVIVGQSDHSIGNYTCFGAVAMGASILEKHFTSSRSWAGPDISSSITPSELEDLIKGSRAVWEARGGYKTVLPEERIE